MDNKLNILGIDLSQSSERDCTVIFGYAPKVRTSNKYLQKIFNKLFGYKIITKRVTAKVVKISASDCPIDKWDGSLTLEL